MDALARRTKKLSQNLSCHWRRYQSRAHANWTEPETPASSVPDNGGDRQMLVALYNDTNGTNGSGWDADVRVNCLSTNPIGEWVGVTSLILSF